MTEQLKYITSELNKQLGTSYDLIKFDALNEVQHLQVLIDLLAHYDAGQKIRVTEEEPEVISLRLFEMLRNVKYKPEADVDVSSFRKNLVTGDRNTIFALLQWLLNNSEKVKKTAYLAKFLVRPDIPPDILGIADMADLLDVHDKLIEEFKEAHKRSVALGQHNSAEVINDIKEMGMERDIVIKRLETAQINLSDVPNKEHLLNISKSYRAQQEKAKHLESQLNEQKEKLKKAGDHLQRNLVSFRGQAPTPKTPRELLHRLNEEIKVNEYLSKEKHPEELANAQRDLSVLHGVQTHDNITRDNLLQIQEKIEAVNRDVENMVQKKMALSDPQDDKLTPFRHQAAVIKRNKQATAEKLEELKTVLRDIESRLSEKQTQVQQLLGDTVLRGEELKKYVNKLRAKSSVYKRQRAILASLKSEAGVLMRSLEILQSRDVTLEIALLNHKKLNVNLDSQPMSKENYSLENLTKRAHHEILQMVAQVSQKLTEVKQEVTPFANHLKPMKEEFQALQQQYEQKKRVYDSTSINLASQMEPLELEVTDLRKTINSQEEEWKTLRQRIEKAEQLLEIIDNESKLRSGDFSALKQPSKMESLQIQINQQEKQAALLKEEQKIVSDRQSMLGEQSIIWSQLHELLECKMQCIEEANKKQGSVTITKQAQTLTL